MPTLGWVELKPVAREAFRIWMSGSDFEWAREAWSLLTKAGLCSYDTERERHIVIARFLALASIYRDWCSVAFDETQGDDLTYWVDELEIEPMYLGQLVPDEELSDDPDEARDEVWHILLDRERARVVDALRSAYGGKTEDLFVALWRSVRGFDSPDPDEEDYIEQDYSAILNDATAAKVAAYAWITEGCPNVRPV